MKRVVIESPYAGDVERNLEYARRAMRDCILHDEAPYASHLLYTQPGILNDNDPTERALGIFLGFAWRDLADSVIFYTDYGWSSGMKAARDALTYEKRTWEERQIGPNPVADQS
jgi:hypothetical protein